MSFSKNEITLSNNLWQKVTLRFTSSNTLQRKSWQQLMIEHKRLGFFDAEIDKNRVVTRNICEQSDSTLNLQLQLRISIADLQVDNVHTERFLLCRVIANWMKLDAILTLVEDPEGNVERLALYNCADISEKDESN